MCISSLKHFPFSYSRLQSHSPLLAASYSFSCFLGFTSNMYFSVFSLAALLPLTTAHFILNWPTNRGFDDSLATGFPCGGFDNVKSPRTEFPLSGGPIQLDMQHPQTRVAVYLALGNDPGSSYNIVLRPQLTQQGLGDFCLGQIQIPSGLNISAGTNGTIQVVTNGDPEGGLYQVRDHMHSAVLQNWDLS